MTELRSKRETAVLTLLGCYRYLTARHVERFLFDGSPVSPMSQQVMVRRVLGSLRRSGLVDAATRSVGGPVGGSAALIYRLSVRGAHLAASLMPGYPLRRVGRVGTFMARHSLATAEVGLAFRKEALTHADHELLLWECDWQTFQRLGVTAVVPDARLVYAGSGVELDAFIEVDLGTEGGRFFARKITGYLDLFRNGDWRRQFGAWPTILVVTPTETRSSLLRRVTEAVIASQSDASQIGARTEFAFCPLPNLVSDGPLGVMWKVAGKTEPRALLPTPSFIGLNSQVDSND